MTAGEVATRIAAKLGVEVDIILDVGYRPRVMRPEELLAQPVSRGYHRYRLPNHNILYKKRA